MTDFEPRLDRYRGEAPHNGTDTSAEAAARTPRTAGQTRVWETIGAWQGTYDGLTCGDVENFTGLTHQSASARLREMSQGDNALLWVVGTRTFRGTGRRQRVYATAAYARARGWARVDTDPPPRPAAPDLFATIREAVAVLDAEHRGVVDDAKDPWGCETCHGSWPCPSRRTADMLRALLPDDDGDLEAARTIDHFEGDVVAQVHTAAAMRDDDVDPEGTSGNP